MPAVSGCIAFQVEQLRLSDIFVSEDDVIYVLVSSASSVISSTLKHASKVVENEVLVAACCFYFRFFSCRALTEFSPSTVMYGCLLLACKTEEAHHVTIHDMLGDLARSYESVALSALSIEFDILKALNFEAVVEQPWSTLLLFCDLVDDCGSNSSLARELFDQSAQAILEWIQTPVIMSYDATQLSLCGFMIALEKALSIPSTSMELSSIRSRVSATLPPGIEYKSIFAHAKEIEIEATRMRDISRNPAVKSSNGVSQIRDAVKARAALSQKPASADAVVLKKLKVSL